MEDAQHVWLCKHSGATECWEKSMVSLQRHLAKEKTAPRLARALYQGLMAWREGSEMPAIGSRFLRLEEVMRSQQTIGWRAVLEGCLTREWRGAQQRYKDFIKSRRSSLRWATALVKKLWDIAWDMWDHRNQVLHHKEKGQHEQRVDAEIRAQFHLGPAGVTATARGLFRGGVEALLQKQVHVREAWLYRVTRGRERFERVTNGYSQERQGLSRWLAGN